MPKGIDYKSLAKANKRAQLLAENPYFLTGQNINAVAPGYGASPDDTLRFKTSTAMMDYLTKAKNLTSPKLSDYELRNQRITSGTGTKMDSIAAGLLPRATKPDKYDPAKELESRLLYLTGIDNPTPAQQMALQKAQKQWNVLHPDKNNGTNPNNIEELNRLTTGYDRVRGLIEGSSTQSADTSDTAKQAMMTYSQGIERYFKKEARGNLNKKLEKGYGNSDISTKKRIAESIADYAKTLAMQEGSEDPEIKKKEALDTLKKYMLKTHGVTWDEYKTMLDEVNESEGM
jgi:hypothetical protein